ncbi:hypothetical protein [Burkholderia sp. LMU1-1-1.1]|uniref:hypothetical protein n=1 Tax=Burkholderia sp. LMU1-1-1.1 TaxID=3135266 RepID=UPI0034339F21
MNRTVFSIILVLLLSTVSFTAGSFFLTAALRNPPEVRSCTDQTTRQAYSRDESKEFWACRKALADTFQKYDYAESKDLAKSFLTILVAVFVASITFSEKIAGIAIAGIWTKTFMITCWVALLVAIVFCGCGLALMSIAVGWAAHSPHTNFFLFEFDAARLFVMSGLFFGGGLAAMLATGIISFIHPPSPRQ